MLCHSAGRVSANYHIVIFERSHMTVHYIQAYCHVDALFTVDSLSLTDVDIPDWVLINSYMAGKHRCVSRDIHSGFSGILGVSVAVSVPELRDSYRGAPAPGAPVGSYATALHTVFNSLLILSWYPGCGNRQCRDLRSKTTWFWGWSLRTSMCQKWSHE